MDSLAPSRRLARAAALVVPLIASGCISSEPIPRSGERHVSWARDSEPVLAISTGSWAFDADSPSFTGWATDTYLVEPWMSAVPAESPVLLQSGFAQGDDLAARFPDGTVETLMPGVPDDGCTRLGWAGFADETVVFCQRSKRMERAAVVPGESLEWSLLTELDPLEAEFQAGVSAQGSNRLLAVGPGGVFTAADGGELVSPTRVAGASPGAVVRADPHDSRRFAVGRDGDSGGDHVLCAVEDWEVGAADCQSLGLGDGLSTLGFMRLGEGPSAVFMSGRVVRSPDYLWMDGAVREVDVEGDESELTLLARIIIDVDGNGVDELILLPGDGQPPRVFEFDGDRTFEERP